MWAWLDTTPEKQKQPRRKDWVGGMPDKGALPELMDWLAEVGPVVPEAGTIRPVGWRELAAWMQCTGEDLTPWECSAIIDLSTAYLNQHHAAKAIDCVAPWADSEAVDHRALLAKRRRRHAKND
jgi:hypothetical protein